MTLNQLKYVIEIARTGSINKAASNLFISQPVLSASIKSLETECGKPLFSRSNRGIELTPFGKVFLSYITPIHMQLCQLDDMIFKEQKKPQHHLTIASNGFHFISNICSELYKKYQSEGIKLESREAFGIEALNLVSNQIAEIGIIRQWSCYKNLYSSQCRALNLEYYPITRLNIAVTVGTGSPLFYRKESSISRDMLKPYPMVMYDYMDSGPFADIFEKLKLSGSGSRIVTSSRSVIYEILEHCYAWYLNSNYTYSIPVEEINKAANQQKTLTLSDCDITSEIGWVKSKELPLSPLAEEAIKMIRDLLIPNTWELSGRIKG